MDLVTVYTIKFKSYHYKYLLNLIYYFFNAILMKKFFFLVDDFKIVNLPIKQKSFSVIKGPHVHKNSGEHFGLLEHKLLISFTFVNQPNILKFDRLLEVFLKIFLFNMDGIEYEVFKKTVFKEKVRKGLLKSSSDLVLKNYFNELTRVVLKCKV